MKIYIEKQARDYPQTKKILEKYKNAQILYIDHYKNIFDKNSSGLGEEKSLIIAKLTSPAVTKAPSGYGHTLSAYFFKTGLNCIFDCSYCYLKGLFKNEHMVLFVNYEDIKRDILEQVKKLSAPLPSPLPTGEGEKTTLPLSLPLGKGEKSTVPLLGKEGVGEVEHRFYSGDYSDVLGMDPLSGFCENFIPFFEEINKELQKPSPLTPLPKGEGKLSVSLLDKERPGEGKIMMEIRSKSANVQPFLRLGFVPQFTEISFSLNPQELISDYERGTASLDARIKAINTLLEKGFKVGLRFLPILPVKNWKELYTDFIEKIQAEIDMEKIHSSFASGLLYTKKDYNTMQKKYPNLDILYMLELENDDFYREAKTFRDEVYTMFKTLDKGCIFCLEN